MDSNFIPVIKEDYEKLKMLALVRFKMEQLNMNQLGKILGYIDKLEMR